jgi:hypothetical protein
MLAQAPLPASPFALRGTIVTPDVVIDSGTISITNGAISAVSPKAVTTRRVVDVDGVILPGLVNLHDHLTFNVFPRWTPPRRFSNRYEWMEDPEYIARIDTPHEVMEAAGLGCVMERYGDIRAMLGGATASVGSLPPPFRNRCGQDVIRNIDVPANAAARKQGQILHVSYDIFPFELTPPQASAVRQGLRSKSIGSSVLHIAEGVGAAARREFLMMQAAGYVRSDVVVVQGVALVEADFKALAASGAGFVWSPQSNFVLYGQTVDMAMVERSGVKIAVGPDWAVTGSAGMIAGVQYASKVPRTGAPLSSKEWVTRATRVPAQLSGVKPRLGTIAVGAAADVIVLRRSGTTPYDALLQARPGDLKLVIVRGEPVFGDPDLMAALLPGQPLEFADICGERRAFHVQRGGEKSTSLSAVRATLTAEMQRRFGIPLAPLVECR